MKRLLLATAFLLSIGASAQTVNLLKNINTATNVSGSSPANFTYVGGVIFFTANDPERGTELWKTDGVNAAGTVLVKDINPGSSSSSPFYLTAVGSVLYFAANDGVNGIELWRSDGTTAGTEIVKDIYTGDGNSSSPQYIVTDGTTLYFSATNGTNGREMWKSTGAVGNATMLTEIFSGSTGSNPQYLTNANGRIFFAATGSTAQGNELWMTDGGAPSLVEDLYTGTNNNSYPQTLTAINAATEKIIYFSAYNSTHGQELWRSDGTAAGTYVVSIYSYTPALCLPFCITDFSGSSSPDYFATTGTYMFFAATSYANGREVYYIDKDDASATLVEDEVVGGDLSPLHLTNLSGTIYFSGNSLAGDRELYKATTSAVTLVHNVNASADSSPTDLEVGGSFLYFTATHATQGTELYRTNGTTLTYHGDLNTAGNALPQNKAYLGGKLYMSLDRNTIDGRELWTYNGTSTSLLKDINGGSEDGVSTSSTLFSTGTTLYFSAQTSSTGYELWKSDGTLGGTVAVADINPGIDGSFPKPLGFTNSLLQFSAYTTAESYEFYTSTGVVGNFTAKHVNTVDASGSYPGDYSYVTMGNDVYFSAYHPSSGTELWKSASGATPTLLGGVTGLYSGTGSSYPQYLTVFGSYVYFRATDDVTGTELFLTNGTSIFTTENKNISGDFNPTGLCVVGSNMFFAGDNGGGEGIELWKTTSGSATITMVKPAGVNPGSANANPQSMTNVNGTLMFRAINGSSGAELWKSDGTDVGTVLVKDIHPSSGSDPSNLTAVGSILYFTANDGTNGTELWKSDGTTGGTVIVNDIFSGISSSSPSKLENINGTLYFRASNGSGLNLMKTNGTAAGTIVATTSGGSVTYQGVDDIQYLNQDVFWIGTSNTYGKEILYVKAEPLNQPASVTVNTPTAATLNVSWPAASGSPAGYLVMRHAGSVPTALPVDGASPGINSTFASGTGAVAYVGAGTSFTDTGLTANTTYHYVVFAYNNGGSSVNIYKPHSPPTNFANTLAANPTVQASAVSTSNVLQTSITLNWASGNGTERIVLAKPTTAPAEIPTDGTAYTGNSVFTSASLLGTSRIIYRGSGSSVTVTALSSGVLYQFMIYELNGSGSQTNYLTSTAGASGSATTQNLDGNQPTSLVFSSIGTSTIDLNWTAATAPATTGYIVTRKALSDPTDEPQNMTSYSVSGAIGGTGTTVVYNSDNNAITSFNDVGLSTGTLYFYRVYAKTDITTYVTSQPLTGSQTTLAAEPLVAANTIELTPTTTSLQGTLAFSLAPDATSYIVLQRQFGTVSPSAPVDGTTYAVGNMIDDSKVVFVGDLSDLPFVSTGLDPNTLYYFAAFSAAGSGAAINYLTSSSATASKATLDFEPANQPSNFIFENITPNSFDVTFTDAPTTPSGYIVLRNTGSPVADAPDDGAAYVDNQTIVGATVVHVGSGTSFTETGLIPNTTYYYAVMAYNGSGETTNYLVAGPGTASQVTPAAEPAAQPTAFTFNSQTTTSLSFTFTAAAGGADGYLIIRNSGSAPTATPIDGQAYSAGGLIEADVVVYSGSLPSFPFTDNNNGDVLIEDRRYYYKVFSFNGTTNTYNYLTTSPLEGDAFTLADEPIDHPVNMAFSDPTTTAMTVAFDEPASPPASYLVVRKAGSAPAGLPVDGMTYGLGDPVGGDGTVAYIGSTPTFEATGLTAFTVYHFSVYPFNGSDASSNFLTTTTVGPPAVPVLTGSRTTLQNEPVSQPTSLSFTDITTTSAQINFTASGATRYIVIRRTGSAPTELPIDGIVYSDNSDRGLSKVTYTTNIAGISSITDGLGTTAPMTPGTKYFYAIYGYNASSAVALNANYLTSAPLTGSVDILALQPTAQATGLNFSNFTSSSVGGSFTAAAGSPTGYLVVRRVGGAPTEIPVNATTYTAGQTFGDGKVVYVGPLNTFDDTGLTAEATAHYKIYSYNGDGGSIHYLTTLPLSNSVTILNTQPPQPTGFSVTSKTETSIELSFTPSSAANYLVLRKEGSAPSETPVDRTAYLTDDDLLTSHIVWSGAPTFPIIDNGLSAGTIYHYVIFGYNGSSAPGYNYNLTSPLTSSVSTLATEPASSPTALNFSGTTISAMTASFTAASGSPTGYLVLRKATTAPTGDPVDGVTYADGASIGGGTVVQTGSSLTANNTGLSSETIYHYRVFAYNGTGTSINYRTASFLSGSMTTLDTEPAQPTGFNSSNIATTSLSISMTLSTAEHCLILRQADSAPIEEPVDGTEYTAGNDLGSSTIVLAGNAILPINDTGLNAGTTYFYTIFGYNGGSADAYNYNIVSPLTGSTETMAVEPSTQPTAMVFTDVTSSTVAVSFTAATGSPEGYLVIRREGATPTSGPDDGVAYSLGDDLGLGDVVSVGGSLTFDESGLSSETDYYYQVYAFNGDGATANYRQTSPLSSNFKTLDTEPTQPTGFISSNIATTSMSISMTLSGADHYLVLRKAGSAPDEEPVDGTEYFTGDDFGSSTIVLAGDATLPINDTGLTAGTTYFYTIYAYNGTSAISYNYNIVAPLIGTAETMAVEPSTQPTGMVFTNINSSSVTVSFTAATSSPEGYLVIRREAAAPTSGPDDGAGYIIGDDLGLGDVVFVGPALTFDDPGLLPETDYYYQVYAFNGDGVTANYLSSSPLSNNFKTLDTEPAQPTAFSASNVTASSFSISITLSAAEHYLILRREGSAPDQDPVDGIEYSVGDDLGSSEVIMAGSIALPINETGRSAGTEYHYAIYGYNGTSAITYNYNTVSPLRGAVGTPAAEPSAQPTGLVFSNINSSSVHGAFTAATGSPDGYIVIRREGQAPSLDPEDVTLYNTGDDIGDGSIVVSVGVGLTFDDSGLTEATTYYYQVYSYYGSGLTSNFLTSAPLDGNFITRDTEPAQPTSFTTSNITSNSISVGMTLSGADHYLILRKAGSAPGELPGDGTEYVTGEDLGSSKILLAGNITLPVVDTGLLPGTVYHYAIFAYNGASEITYNYNTTSPLIGSTSTYKTQPTTQPTALLFTGITSASAIVSFAAATPAPDGYLVIRREGQAPSAGPIDGTSYTVGQPLGQGNVISVGPGISVNEPTLSSETEYFYQVYAYNGSDLTANYLTSSPLSGSFTTLDTEPGQPTLFTTSNITSSTISVGMTLSGADHYLILRKAAGAPSEVPVDGVGYVGGNDLGSSFIVHAGTITSPPINDTGLLAGTVYHYKVFAYNGAQPETSNYNITAPLSGNATTHAAQPTAQPGLLAFTNVDATSAKVSFAAATGTPTGYLVIRREGQAPSSGPVDASGYSVGDDLGGGKVASVGAALTFNESGLTTQTAYYYQVYAYNGNGSTTNYLSTSPLSGNFTTLAIEPAQPTNFIATAVGTSTASINFTTSGAQQYLILRKADSAPLEVPVDGTAYVPGQDFGNSFILRAGAITSLPISETGLAAGTVYHYAIFGYNGVSAVTNNYNTTAHLTGNLGTLADEPVGVASSMVFSAVTTSAMTVSFSAAPGSPDGYLVLRRQNTAPSALPVDRTDYTVGNDLVSGTKIVYIGDDLTFDDSGLNTEVNYFYSVFSYNGGGVTRNFLTPSALTNNRKTLAAEPSPATSFSSSNITTTSLSITFTESVNAQHHLILRKEDSAPNDIPVDGLAYTTNDMLPGGSKVVFAGNISALPINQPGLTAGTVYHYKIYAYNGSEPATNNYSTALSGTTGTHAVEPTGQPANITFSDITTNGADISYTQASGTPEGYLVIRREDTAPTGAPIDGTTYAVDAPLGGGFVAYVGPDLSFTESGLSPEKTYHYRAFAYNGGPQTINYLASAPATESFVTLANEPTTQPSNIQFSAVLATGFTVSFQAASTTVSGYIAIRKTGSDPAGLPLDGVSYTKGDMIDDGIVAFVGTATTFNETLPQLAYHYVIYSFRGTGASTNYKTDNAPKNTLTLDTTGPEFTNNTGTTLFFGDALVVKYTIEDNDSGIPNDPKPQLFYRPLNAEMTTNFSQKEMSLSGGMWQATLSSTEIQGLGLDYKVTAVNTVGVATTSPTVRLRVAFSGTTEIPELQGGDEVANFNIIAIPLELSNNAGNVVFSELHNNRENETEWRMFHWNGSHTDEIKDLSTFDVEPGKGYWLITARDYKITPGVGLAVPSTEQDPFEMVLTAGWNQIGNPYLFNLWWPDVKTENPGAGSLPLRLFTGGTQPFAEGDILKVFRGGFTQVGSATTLQIPTKKNTLAGGRENDRRPKTNGLDSDDWEVILNVRHGDVANPFGGVGMSRDASESYDHFDDFSMPRFMDYVELNHPKKVHGMIYTKDILPLEESHVWDFSIDASAGGPTTLTWDNSYFGSNDRHIVLWDVEEQLATDMRKGTSYSFVLGASRKFKVFFGDKAFVEEQSAANGVLIHNISPNPTTADAMVEFSIPGQARTHVKVRVVNGMGQQIATVLEGEMEAGYHAVQWSGNDSLGLRPAAGVYLVEVINGEHRTSKRLVIK